MEPIIELKNISKSYQGTTILKNLSLQIYKGDSIIVIGPGGCGKTVFMKILSLVIAPDDGDIFYFGRNTKEMSVRELNKIRLKMGMLFQNYALFDSLTVRENVGFYLDYHSKMPDKEISSLVTKNLNMVKLSDIEHLKPSELSGGMKKRVGIARAIIHNPEIIFFDEPTAGLDPITTDSISKMINQLQKELDVTLIAVSNDRVCFRRIGKKMAMMYDGAIYKIDDKNTMLQSDDPVVEQFVNGRRKGPISTIS